MAHLKTYSISMDITAKVCDLLTLHHEIDESGNVSGFDGLLCEGDCVTVIGESFKSEIGCDAVVMAHSGVSDAPDLESGVPRMTTAERTALAKVEGGAVVFDTDLAAIYVYDGESWSAK